MTRLAVLFILVLSVWSIGVQTPSCHAQTAVLRRAPKLMFPNKVDSNSPCHWDGDTLYLLNSIGRVRLGKGADQFGLEDAGWAGFDNTVNGGRWIECTWKTDDGVLYGWYHNEPGGLCPGSDNTCPRIGACRSTDNGASWNDLGIIIEARPGTLNCKAKNGAFAGGNGDFCCMLDRDGRYMYFYFGAYAGDVIEQGICVAKMLWKDRENPIGKVWKYHKGQWDQPGIGGSVTPIFPATVDFKRSNCNSFWGPAIHWNTYLKQYVMLLNHIDHKGWPQEGIYISYGNDIADPNGWTKPLRLLEGTTLYPEVIGVNKQAKETDKLCGQQGRFYILGKSANEIIFFREGEDTTKLPPIYTPDNREIKPEELLPSAPWPRKLE